MTAFVISAGLQTTLQAARRMGYRHRGVPWSGAADPVSLAIANRLVGNPFESVALEVTFGGLELGFDAPTHLALTGAVGEAILNDAPIAYHQTFRVLAGQTLSIAPPAQGLRTYLAVAGGWLAQSVLGSSSTYLPADLGGLDGRALQANDTLQWQSPKQAIPMEATPDALQPSMQNSWTLRATPSAEWHWLTGESQERVFSKRFGIDRASNRMGLRLTGNRLRFVDPVQMQSAAVFPGTVQCPASGDPIALLADGQTTGGYPRICQIVRADRHLLGQIRPGDRLRLLHRTDAQARTAYAEKLRLIKAWVEDAQLY